MKRVIWAEAATKDLDAIEDYLVDAYGTAFARHVINTLIDSARWLLRHPHGGERLSFDGWRKWKPRKGRHVLIYRVVEDGIEVLRVRHERNDWRPVSQD